VKPELVDKDLEITEEDFLQIALFLGFILLWLKGC